MSDPNDYTIGWICAITIEYVAAQSFLDEHHEGPEHLPFSNENDYTLGRIGRHNVVISVLPSGLFGTSSAARVAADMLQSFPNIRVCLMVGIGGGAPSLNHDIRLGDVVVSAPFDGGGGVAQYDFGRMTDQGFQPTGFLDQPPTILSTAVKRLQSQYEIDGHRLKEAVSEALERNPRLRKKFQRPDLESDRLYQSHAIHPQKSGSTCAIDCGDDPSYLVSRNPRSHNEDNPAIHYGLIASANCVMNNADIRDQMAAEMGVLCFDIEAAGLMNSFPCLVVRGICDYSDSHKNREWQGYAAMVAAAYAKNLLCQILPQQVEKEEQILHIFRPPNESEFSELTEFSENLGDSHRILADQYKTIDYGDQKVDFDDLPFASEAVYDSDIYQHEVECYPGTRTELLQQIREWAWSPHGKCLFWLNGMAGTGKSTISRTVAKSLNQTEHLGASFFFRGGDSDLGNATKLFPTLVRQLVLKCPAMLPSVLKALLDDPNVASKSLSEQFDKLLLQPLLNLDQLGQKPQIAVIVIDALDECQNDQDVQSIIRLLPLLQKATVVRLRVFLTSRPESSIRFGFQNMANHNYQDLALHEISNEVIEHDLFLFLSNRFAKIQLERNISRDWPGDNVIKSIIQFSAPSFILAISVCRFIESPEFDPMDRLSDILPQLDDGTYNQVYNRLPNGRIECERQESEDSQSETNKKNSICDPSDIESIFSTESFLSSQSSQGEITSIAIAELTNLLLNDDDLKLLYPMAILKVGPDKFQRNFAHILRNYGRSLNGEASNEIQRQAARFVQLSARQTSAQLRVALMQQSGERPKGKQLESDVSKSAQINAWLTSQTEERPYSNADANELFMDSDSTSSESDHQNSLGTLEEVKEFMVSTKAFPGLRQEFQEWLEGKRKNNRKGWREKIEGPLEGHETNSELDPNIAQDCQLENIAGPEPLGIYPVGSTRHQKSDNSSMEDFTAESTGTREMSRLSSYMFHFLNIFAPPAADYQRISYICGCGELSYLDVKELSAGGIERFRRKLLSSIAAVNTSSHISSSPTRLERPPQAHLNPMSTSSMPSENTTSQEIEPFHRSSQSVQSEDIQACSTTSQNEDPQFVLLCMKKRSSTALVHVEVGSLTNDQYFFRQIRQEYQTLRREHGFRLSKIVPLRVYNLFRAISTWLPRFPSFSRLFQFPSIPFPALPEMHILKIESGDFVRFSLVPIGLKCCPSWFKTREFPPEVEVRTRRYLYEPVPMEDVELFHIPLRHLLKPGPHTDRFWMTMIPKKLRDPLVRVPGTNRPVIGWGIRMNESLNWVFILPSILVILLAVSVGVIIYAAVTSDNSSAFGLGAFLLAIFTVYLTYQYLAWEDDI